MIDIYKILHQDKVIYVGQTSKGYEYRFVEHLWNAQRQKKKMKLYTKMRKYPQEEFSVELIETVDEAIVDEREQHWISYYNTIKEGCNSAIGGRTNRGMKYGPEYGERISKLRKENYNYLTDTFNGSDEQKKMLSEKTKGKPRPWSSAIGKANKGKRTGDENPSKRPEVRALISQKAKERAEKKRQQLLEVA